MAQEPEVRRWLDAVAAEHGAHLRRRVIVETLQGWIDQDRKHTALKALQGMIWEAGYRSARLHRAHLSGCGRRSCARWHAAGHRAHGVFVGLGAGAEAVLRPSARPAT